MGRWSRMAKKAKSEIRNINWKLSGDIIQVILWKDPFLNLPSCRLVCKSWNNLVLTCKFDPPILISNLFFAYSSSLSRNLRCVDFNPKHLEGMSSVASFSLHPTFSSRIIYIVNSCNGLLCFLICKQRPGIPKPRVLCILNPITNEYLKFPFEKLKALRGGTCRYGLGFTHKTKQYKVARITFVPDQASTSVEIFTFGTTGEWTPVGLLPSLVIVDHGVYFNGGLYWVATHQDEERETSAIYRLDLENEKLQKISFQPLLHLYFSL